jgi:hypothetical protein
VFVQSVVSELGVRQFLFSDQQFDQVDHGRPTERAVSDLSALAGGRTRSPRRLSGSALLPALPSPPAGG